jgi:hypothetical protein
MVPSSEFFVEALLKEKEIIDTFYIFCCKNKALNGIKCCLKRCKTHAMAHISSAFLPQSTSAL